jgi:hypothetical protein
MVRRLVVTEYACYTETNTVMSVVFYDWMAEFDIVGARDILDRIVEFIGRPPDIVTVADDKQGKDYLHRNFVKRNVIHRKEWELVSYLWKRSADVLSDFAIEIGCESIKFRNFRIHLDEAAVDDPRQTMKQIVDFVAERIQPTYGIAYAMPYFWGPGSFARGQGSSRFATVDKTFYGPPETMRERSYEFSPVFLANQKTHNLNSHIRDLFELNFLSKGHLARLVDGKMLRDWIIDNGFGKLHQLTAVTWAWEVPGEEIQRLRIPLIRAGLTVVKQ